MGENKAREQLQLKIGTQDTLLGVAREAFTETKQETQGKDSKTEWGTKEKCTT